MNASCAPLPAALPRRGWDAAAVAALLQPHRVAFVMVRAQRKASHPWLPNLAGDVAPAPIHLLYKRELTPLEECEVQLAQSRPRAHIEVHQLHESAAEAGPKGGRECSGYLDFIINRWAHLPERLFFMHEDADPLSTASIRIALQASGYSSLGPTAGALLRCFAPLESAALATVASPPSVQSSTTYQLPRDLHNLLRQMGLTAPRCVITQCCATFMVSRATIKRHPIAFYRSLRAFALTPRTKDTAFTTTNCHALEHVWHIIFGAPPASLPLWANHFNGGTSSRLELTRAISAPPSRPVTCLIAWNTPRRRRAAPQMLHCGRGIGGQPGRCWTQRRRRKR